MKSNSFYPALLSLILLVFFSCHHESVELTLQASFSIVGRNCTTPCSVSFVNTSENATAYRWDFGDGQTSTEANPVHFYKPSAVSYIVSMTAIGQDSWQTARDSLRTGSVVQWDRTFGGTEFDYIVKVIPGTDGGYLLAGHSPSNRSVDKSEDSWGGSDYWVIKIDENGRKMWDKTFGGKQDEGLTDVISTTDGGYLLFGWSESGASGNRTASHGRIYGINLSDIWMVKIDRNGNKQWDKAFEQPYNFSSLNYVTMCNPVELTDGSYFMGGRLYISSASNSTYFTGGPRYIVAKFNAQGQEGWKQIYEYGTYVSMLPLSDGGYLLYGYSSGGKNESKSENSRGNTDYWVVNVDADGKKRWDKTIGGSENDWLGTVCRTPDNGFLLGGTSTSYLSGDKTDTGFLNSPAPFLEQGWVVKLSSTGQKEWDRVVGREPGGVRAVLNTPDKGYLVASGSADYSIVKITTTGAEQWTETIQGNGYDNLISAITTLDGGYLLIGNSSSDRVVGYDKSEATRGKTDFWIVKVKR